MGVLCMGDMTGGGTLLPANREGPKEGPKKLGRTYAPMKVHQYGRGLPSSVALTSPPKIGFARPSGPVSPTASPYDAAANGGSSEGPGAAYYDDPASFNAFADPASSAPLAPMAVASPAAAQSDTQKMTLAQAQASGPAPVGYYIAGGVAVAALAAGLYFFTR